MSKQNEYIDIHTHILPGVDDGAKDTQEALAMLQQAVHAGACAIVLTPHFEHGRNTCTKEELRTRFAQFKEAVQKEAAQKELPDVTLYLGNEVLYSDGILKALENDEICTINDTKYVLVEFNIRIAYRDLYRAMRELTDARYRPIIAHVERYACLTGHMERIEELDDLGVCLQMNASSLPGKTFDANSRWCRKLMSEGMISFLASDAHNTTSRSPSLKAAVEWMEKHLSETQLTKILQKNARTILVNSYIK